MSDQMKRREFLTSTGTAMLLASFASTQASATQKMQPPWVWTAKNGIVNNNMRIDENPLENEFDKYARCTYCGMVRMQWSHSRHLIQYDDNSCEGTCSIHCMAVGLSINLDRGPKNIWCGDAGSEAEIKPLIDVDLASYAINPDKTGTMSKISKWAYADPEKANAGKGSGQTTNFDGALEAAYADMASNTVMIRKRRKEKRAKMSKKGG